ncbi:MAG: methylated-DNA--[protein]-cysteine S-methyltransferase [Oscillospiraceae bacterium]|nr:methylated-DNA--[protein]-cysteine S-methyltransferase [Oscillospiraceae bacterium]
MYYKTSYDSPIGRITIACDGDNIIGVWNENQKYHGDSIYTDMEENNDMPVFALIKKWLDRYFVGGEPAISELTIAPIGSQFRQDVWNILCEIPYGEIVTYGDIAKKIAIKRNKEGMSAQAVGGAVGHNPISIIIPCHRVVGTGGSLTGYAGGIDKKIKLLEIEGADMTRFSIPTKGTAL